MAGEMQDTGTWTVKTGLAQMLKGGVIMDVVTADQARIAEDAGAVSVMALERVPADIRKAGGVARMADPTKIEEIKRAVTIPVMAKCRIGHFVEAQVLQSLEIDYIDESEVLTPADEDNHVWKHDFAVPFVCGCRNLGEALRRIREGAAMIRTKGEAGTGNVVEAVRHARTVLQAVRRVQGLNDSGADDAARRRRRVRGLRDLQVREPAAHGGGDRQGDDQLRRSGYPGPGLPRVGRAHARAGDGGDPRRGAARRTRLVAHGGGRPGAAGRRP